MYIAVSQSSKILPSQVALRIVSQIGLYLSVAGLAIIVVVYSYFRFVIKIFVCLLQGLALSFFTELCCFSSHSECADGTG